MTPEPPFILALDVGSSSARASLYDRRARPVPDGQASRHTSLHTAADGTAEMDAAALADTVDSLLDEAVARAGSQGRPIAAVALDTLVFAACGLDGSGAPVTPLYTYADTRARADAEALRREVDFAAVYDRTGCPLHTSYMPARLRWLARTHPDAARRVESWAPVGSLLYRRWFGVPPPVSYSVAAWTGLFDRRRLAWDEELVRHLRIPAESLGQLADYDQARRGLAPEYAKRWPALRDVPFFLAVGDGAAANVGSGCVSPERVALTVGTSGALRVALPGATPDVPPGLWVYKISTAEALLGGALNDGGSVFAWATEALQLPKAGDLDTALRRLPPDGHGLTVLPFLTGERSPGWSNEAHSATVGIHPGTTAIEVLQAWLEAVAYRLALLARLLGPHAAPDHEMVASGGALAASPYWAELLAHVIGRRVRLSSSGELTSRGAAILALRALGIWRTLADEPLETEAVFEPDPARAPVYEAAIERQHRLYTTLLGADAQVGRALDAAVRGRTAATADRSGC